MAGGSFGGGSGILADPYIITDAADLNAVRNSTSAHYKLGNSVNLGVAPYNTGVGWVPIPTFTGSLDGAGYSITNLYINSSSAIGGLFNTIGNDMLTTTVTIKNLTLSGINVVSISRFGGLSNYLQGSADIENVTISGSATGLNAGQAGGGLIGTFQSSGTYNKSVVRITKCSVNISMSGGSFLGGLIGVSSVLRSSNGVDISISDCHTSGSIVGSRGNFGGLIGHLSGDNALKIDDCSSSIAILVTGVHTMGFIGGFIGQISGVAASGYIKKSFATGSITTQEARDYVGGFIGNGARAVTIEQCYATGKVKTASGNYVGGFIGNADNGIKCFNCYSANEIEIANSSHVGAFVGRITHANTQFEYCLTVSSIVGSAGVSVGGFSPTLPSTLPSDGYFDSNIVGFTGAGISKTTTEMKTKETFVAFDFVGIWEIKSGAYPTLLFSGGEDPPVDDFPAPPSGAINYVMGELEGGLTCYVFASAPSYTRQDRPLMLASDINPVTKERIMYTEVLLGSIVSFSVYYYDGVSWKSSGIVSMTNKIKLDRYVSYKTDKGVVASVPFPEINIDDPRTFPEPPEELHNGRWVFANTHPEGTASRGKYLTFYSFPDPIGNFVYERTAYPDSSTVELIQFTSPTLLIYVWSFTYHIKFDAWSWRVGNNNGIPIPPDDPYWEDNGMRAPSTWYLNIPAGYPYMTDIGFFAGNMPEEEPEIPSDGLPPSTGGGDDGSGEGDSGSGDSSIDSVPVITPSTKLKFMTSNGVGSILHVLESSLGKDGNFAVKVGATKYVFQKEGSKASKPSPNVVILPYTSKLKIMTPDGVAIIPLYTSPDGGKFHFCTPSGLRYLFIL